MGEKTGMYKSYKWKDKEYRGMAENEEREGGREGGRGKEKMTV